MDNPIIQLWTELLAIIPVAYSFGPECIAENKDAKCLQ